MSSIAVTISVDSQAAQAFAAATPDDRRKIELLLNLRLRELTVDSRKSLRQVMDELGAQAERSGLTADVLAELLNGQ